MNECCKENGDNFQVLVMAKTENDRTWKYDEYATPYTHLLAGGSLEKKGVHIHYNPGLRSRLKSEKPDIVIASGSYLCPGTWTIAACKKMLGYKAIFWSESHLGEKRSYENLKLRIREELRNKFYKKFDAFLCPGKLASDLVRNYAGAEVCCIFLPNLIEEQQFAGGHKKTTEDFDKMIFLCPARLTTVKGISEFMDLWNRCSNKEKMQMWIAGEGELKEELENKSQRLRLDVLFLGNKTQAEMIELYAKADMVCLPSLSDSNPLACIEALWEGKPLLVSEHVGNYPETIQQGKNGYVFSYEDADGATKIIETVIESTKEWCTKAGKISREIAENKFNSAVAVKRAYEQMRALINN